MSEAAHGGDLFAGDPNVASGALLDSHDQVRADFASTPEGGMGPNREQQEFLGVQASFGDNSTPAELSLSCGHAEFADDQGERSSVSELVVYGRVGERLYAAGTGHPAPDSETVYALHQLVEEAALTATEEQARWLHEMLKATEAVSARPETLAQTVGRLVDLGSWWGIVPPQSTPTVASVPADARATENHGELLAMHEAPVDARLTFRETAEDGGLVLGEFNPAEFATELRPALDVDGMPAWVYQDVVGYPYQADMPVAELAPAAPAMDLPPMPPVAPVPL
jgi:hypothetical protein